MVEQVGTVQMQTTGTVDTLVVWVQTVAGTIRMELLLETVAAQAQALAQAVVVMVTAMVMAVEIEVA